MNTHAQLGPPPPSTHPACASRQDEWPISSARYTPDRKPVILTQVLL